MTASRAFGLRAAVLVTLLAILATGIASLSLTGPSWSPSSAFRNTTINCSWTTSLDATAQNVTLLRNGTVYNTTYENASLMNLSTWMSIPATNLTKGERWTCRITILNDTSSSSAEINITILNSPPSTEGYPAGVFNSSGVDIGYDVALFEDATLAIDVNGSDADGDSLTYLLADEFCTRTSSSAGTYTCAPAQSDIVSNNLTFVNITFTVTDGQNVGGRTITFNVTPVNDAPAASLTNQTTPVNLTLNYTFSVTDEEGNIPYTFQLGAPAEIADKLTLVAFNANGSIARLLYNVSLPDFNDVGLWNVSINITDNSTSYNGSNNSRLRSYNITLNITSVGRQPYFVNITPSSPYVLSQGQVFQINLSANDPDTNSTITFLDDTSRFAIVTINSNTTLTNATAQINFTPSNADVGNYTVTITIVDAESLQNTTVLNFSVANVNDVPVLNEVSVNATNSGGNTNLSNLTAYANSLFTYTLNVTDPDTLWGEVFNFTSNATLFTINTTTGKIQFTPNDTQNMTGYTVNVTVSDLAGNQSSRLLNLTIRTNSRPYFNTTALSLNCTTKSSCSLPLSAISTDADAGDSVVQYTLSALTGNLTTLAYNTTSGLINFTTLKTDVGNYTYNLTITDSFGATNSSLFTLYLNNTLEAPNVTRYTLGTDTIVETHLEIYELQATDDDYLLSIGENVTFTTNLTINHTITPSTQQNSTVAALLSFTPGLGAAGNYSIHINATDAFGLSMSRVANFTIYALAPAPNITNITPWGADNSSHDIQTTWAGTNETQFSDDEASVVFFENRTVVFNVTVVDSRPLTYNWTVNGTVVSTAQNYSRSYSFFSAGGYDVRVNISNDRLESSEFRWNVTVSDLNRAPVLISNLTTPLSANGTIVFADYFTVNNGTKFFDSDDDNDSSGALNGNESNTLNFTVLDSCSVAEISISGSNLQITGSTVGTCDVRFRATDTGGLTVTSANVTINITDVTEGTATVTTTTSSGGGGSSSSSSITIPLNKKIEVPRAFNIVAPKLVTIYENKTVNIPIIVNNTWTESLKLVRLTARTNTTGVTTSFDTDFFEEIPQNQSREVMLTVSNYRLGGNYEIVVTGNVSIPAYQDDALILLNSIEQSSDGDNVKVKVTFANDLLNQHPECQELNEILDQAKQKIAEGNVAEGSRLVDSVINGCKYLVSMNQKIEEHPNRIDPVININDISIRAILIGVVAFVLLATLAFLMYYHFTHRPEDDI